MSFDPSSKAFDFCYVADAHAGAPTEIFASLRYSYACGRNVSTSANLVAMAPAGDDIVRVTSATGHAGTEAGCVRIWRACTV